MACRRTCVTVVLLAVAGWIAAAGAAEPPRDDFTALSDEYAAQARPLVKQYCLGCHSTALRTGELDLERFGSLADVRRASRVWSHVGEKLGSGEMPPKFAKQPTPEERRRLQGWIERYLHAEAWVNAGDPGPVVLRRLNNAEYTYTIRDLTRVDLDPAREFPIDSAAGEGFTNAGNALAMSPALFAKYLDAGKELARHAVLLPDGFRFSRQSTRRDWTDEILGEIRKLYRSYAETADLGVGGAVGNKNVHTDTRIGLAGRLPLAKYLAATLEERGALRSRRKTVETVARERGLSAKYLGALWTRLDRGDGSALVERLRARWRAARRGDATALAADVAIWQKGHWQFGPVGLIGRQGGPKRWMEPVMPVVTEQVLRFEVPAVKPGEKKPDVVLSLVVGDAGDGNAHDFVLFRAPRLVGKDVPDLLLRDVRKIAGTTAPDAGPAAGAAAWGLDPARFGRHPKGGSIDPASLCVRAPAVIEIRLPGELAAGRELVTTAVLDPRAGGEGSVQPEIVAGTAALPTGLLPSEVEITFSRVTQVFSDHRDANLVRPILVGAKSRARTRFESAVESYRSLFPAALCFNQIVPVDEVLTLQIFFREDDHLVRLMLDDAEKARLDRLWDELDYVSQSALLRVTAVDLLLEVMAGNGGKDPQQREALLPLRDPIYARGARFKQQLLDDEPKQLQALVDFAGSAYRRPLTPEESGELRGLYSRLRAEGLPHEEAFRLTLARVFVASPFLYRLESAPAGTGTGPVSDWDLASRLSFFLWSSQPDTELRAAAASGALRRSEELGRQAARMLGDPRVRRLATEFACQWLHVYDFAALDEKSEKYFPDFATLRGDMYEESILFFTDLFRRGASLLEVFDADHTFVNDRLARFYGIEGVIGPEWRRVDGVRRQGRGGVLGLAATLAKQSGASRTSPIIRGNWVSEVLLGEKLPRPPQGVPQLPSDETATEGLTVRQLVARHTTEPRCAACHRRIDPFGFALEEFDAIGRRRERDLAGRAIDARTKLPDGTEVDGMAGLRDYLLQRRRDTVVRQFCRKLLGYALGRELQLSDEPLLADIDERLRKDGYRSSVAIQAIVESRQFREIRGRDVTLASAH